jgi:hypothetical protein
MSKLLGAGARAATAALAHASNIFFLLPNNVRTVYTIGAFLHTPPADFLNNGKPFLNILGMVHSMDCRF